VSKRLACIEQAIYRRTGKVLGGVADAGEGEVGSSDSRESDSLIVGGLRSSVFGHWDRSLRFSHSPLASLAQQLVTFALLTIMP
jgi:hypothetical protein